VSAAPPRLETRGLGQAFAAPAGEDLVALDGVDLRLEAGEFVSIVGPSGCGKSTLFKILAGLLEPSRGSVLLDGAEPEPGLLGRIGYLPQQDLLMPWRTLLDNVALGLELNGVPRAEARRRAREQLPRFGLEGFERRRPADLSGGMRQRAALLRTFLAGREVMLLDEPFGALDALTRQAMQEWLLELWQTDRTTILFITHDVEEALHLSDRVYVMSARPGRIERCVDVPLPRPRTFEMTASPEFVALRAELLASLRAPGAPD
jgi:ABC-type nitrate/sulfonate/bicarbonate transport system ATPase subunit